MVCWPITVMYMYLCLRIHVHVGINQRDAHIYICTAISGCTGLLRQPHATKKQRLLLDNLASMLILSMRRWIGAPVETSYWVQTSENCRLSIQVRCCLRTDIQHFCRLGMD